MKHNSLTTAVVAGIAGTVGISNLANAASSSDQAGSVVIYPYYTVDAIQPEQTLFFTNAQYSPKPKHIRVRFV